MTMPRANNAHTVRQFDTELEELRGLVLKMGTLVVQQIKDGVPRSRAEALGTPIGDIISVMLRRNEQYRYTSALQVWEDLRRLDVW